MKTEIKASTHLAPVSAVLVSCGDAQDSDIVTIAWAGTVNSEPPMVSISVRRSRYSYELILQNGRVRRQPRPAGYAESFGRLRRCFGQGYG